MQLEFCLFTEGCMGVSGERSRQAGSWGKDFNIWVWDSGQGIHLPVRFVKIQNSPSQISTASLLLSLAEVPMNNSAMKAQLPSIYPAHDGGSAEGGTGWHKPIHTVVALSKTRLVSCVDIQETQKAQGLLHEWKSKVLLNLVFLKHIPSHVSYKPALLLRMSNTNINTGSNEYI